MYMSTYIWPSGSPPPPPAASPHFATAPHHALKCVCVATLIVRV